MFDEPVDGRPVGGVEHKQAADHVLAGVIQQRSARDPSAIGLRREEMGLVSRTQAAPQVRHTRVIMPEQNEVRHGLILAADHAAQLIVQLVERRFSGAVAGLAGRGFQIKQADHHAQ